MANFNTHLAVAAVGSGLCATVALAGHAAPQNYLLTLTLAGAIGGVLPDVDLENAEPSRMLFGALGVVLAFAALFSFKKQYSIAELWLVWIGVYVAVRYGLFTIFHHTAHHRGIFHSFLAGAFFMTLTAIIFDKAFGESPALAWLTGLFVLIGYITHLVLDEIYSVDIQGLAIKRSFGSALKPFDFHSARASLAMAAALALCVFLAPPSKDFRDMVRAPTLIAFLKDRLLPKGNWFDARMVGDTAALESGRAE